MEKWAHGLWLRPDGLRFVGWGCDWQGNGAYITWNGTGVQGRHSSTHEGIHTHSKSPCSDHKTQPNKPRSYLFSFVVPTTFSETDKCPKMDKIHLKK